MSLFFSLRRSLHFFSSYLFGCLCPWQGVWLTGRSIPSICPGPSPWEFLSHHPKAFSTRPMSTEILPILPVGRNLAIGLGVRTEQTTAQGSMVWGKPREPQSLAPACSSVPWPVPCAVLSHCLPLWPSGPCILLSTRPPLQPPPRSPVLPGKSPGLTSRALLKSHFLGGVF